MNVILHGWNCQSMSRSVPRCRHYMSVVNWLALLFSMSCTSIASAGVLFDSVGLSYQYTSIELDESGASSTEKNAHAFKVFAGKKLNEYFTFDYGYQSLGKYEADYDFTVGNFRFIESQSLDLSQNIFAGFSIGRYFPLTVLPEGHQVRPKLLLGGLVWRVDLNTQGSLSDTGVPQDDYSFSGSDYGLSHYVGAGLEYDFGNDLLLTFEVVVNYNVGADAEMVDNNGVKQPFAGRDVLVQNLGLIYRF